MNLQKVMHFFNAFKKTQHQLNKLKYVLFFKNFTNMYHKTHVQIKGNIAHVIS